MIVGGFEVGGAEIGAAVGDRDKLRTQLLPCATTVYRYCRAVGVPFDGHGSAPCHHPHFTLPDRRRERMLERGISGNVAERGHARFCRVQFDPAKAALLRNRYVVKWRYGRERLPHAEALKDKPAAVR